MDERFQPGRFGLGCFQGRTFHPDHYKPHLVHLFTLLLYNTNRLCRNLISRTNKAETRFLSIHFYGPIPISKLSTIHTIRSPLSIHTNVSTGWVVPPQGGATTTKKFWDCSPSIGPPEVPKPCLQVIEDLLGSSVGVEKVSEPSPLFCRFLLLSVLP